MLKKNRALEGWVPSCAAYAWYKCVYRVTINDFQCQRFLLVLMELGVPGEQTRIQKLPPIQKLRFRNYFVRFRNYLVRFRNCGSATILSDSETISNRFRNCLLRFRKLPRLRNYGSETIPCDSETIPRDSGTIFNRFRNYSVRFRNYFAPINHTPLICPHVSTFNSSLRDISKSHPLSLVLTIFLNPTPPHLYSHFDIQFYSQLC